MCATCFIDEQIKVARHSHFGCRIIRRPLQKSRAAFIADYKEKFANPYKAAELGFIDDVIYPHTLRARLHRALEMLKDKRDSNPPKKHTNIPL